MADDAVGLNLVVDPWLEKLWPALDDMLGRRPATPAAEPAAAPAAPAKAAETTPSAVADRLAATALASDAPVPAPAWAALAHPPALPDPAFPDGKVTGVARLPGSYLAVTLSDPPATPPADPAARYFGWTDAVGGGRAWADATALAYAAQAARLWRSHAPWADPDVFRARCLCACRPCRVAITAARCLTSPTAMKRTLAVRFALPPDGAYQPGDAIGVVCPNDAATVDALLARLRLDGSRVRAHGQCAGWYPGDRRLTQAARAPLAGVPLR